MVDHIYHVYDTYIPNRAFKRRIENQFEIGRMKNSKKLKPLPSAGKSTVAEATQFFKMPNQLGPLAVRSQPQQTSPAVHMIYDQISKFNFELFLKTTKYRTNIYLI